MIPFPPLALLDFEHGNFAGSIVYVLPEFSFIHLKNTIFCSLHSFSFKELSCIRALPFTAWGDFKFCSKGPCWPHGWVRRLLCMKKFFDTTWITVPQHAVHVVSGSSDPILGEEDQTVQGCTNSLKVLVGNMPAKTTFPHFVSQLITELDVVGQWMWCLDPSCFWHAGLMGLDKCGAVAVATCSGRYCLYSSGSHSLNFAPFS